MPEPSPFSAWLESLSSEVQSKLPQPSPLLFSLVSVVGLLALFPLLVMLAWDQIAPVLHAPSLTYASAAGCCFFFLVLVGTIAFLKE